MDYDFTTICPHCGEQITIPYEDARHHIYRILGQQSARKRKDRDEHMRKMHQNYRSKLHPKQEAILALSKEQDLNTLKLREIAERVGITGKDRVSRVWQHLDKLKKKGLLDVKRRMEPFQVQQI
jgi:DNA-binding MarR family transcriptional regulator